MIQLVGMDCGIKILKMMVQTLKINMVDIKGGLVRYTVFTGNKGIYKYI